MFDASTKFEIFKLLTVFRNVEPYMDPMIHIFWYVELTMDCRVHIFWYILSYIWTLRSILSGMLTSMDRTVHIMPGNIWIVLPMTYLGCGEYMDPGIQGGVPGGGAPGKKFIFL